MCAISINSYNWDWSVKDLSRLLYRICGSGSISPGQLCSHTPSALNAEAKRSGATCHMDMSQCCYLAKGAKRPSHTTNMISICACIFGLVQLKFIFGLVNSRPKPGMFLWRQQRRHAESLVVKQNCNLFQSNISHLRLTRERTLSCSHLFVNKTPAKHRDISRDTLIAKKVWRRRGSNPRPTGWETKNFKHQPGFEPRTYNLTEPP